MSITRESKFEELTLYKLLKKRNSPFLPKIVEVYNEIKDLLNTRVPQIFPKYTLHDIGHSFRIMEYMSRLVDDLKKLSDLEIALLILSALLHDVGMAISDEDLALIKSDNFPFSDVKFSSMKKLVENDEPRAIEEYIRRIHASLSARQIQEKLKGKFIIPELPVLDYSKDLAQICESHTRNYDWIKDNLKHHGILGEYSYNCQYIAVILRLADILDIDSNRTPYNLYKILAPQYRSDDEWRQHFAISNNNKIILNENTKQKKIVFYGKSNNAHIHRKLLVYIDWIRKELTEAVYLTADMPPQYLLHYDTNPDVDIKPDGYTFSDYRMTLDFRAISSLLMGEKIYGDRALGLRELIQNAIDACRVRQEMEKRQHEFGQDAYQPKVKIILDSQRNQVIIKDNGIGMSLDIIKKHFLNIGVSYYNSEDFLLKDFQYKPIGNFGIGFLSCFMLSNNVHVTTRHFLLPEKYMIDLERGDEYTSITVNQDVNFDGTEIILNFHDFMSAFENNITNVSNFLKTYFITYNISMQLMDKSSSQIIIIENLIKPSDLLEEGLIKIELQDYLKDILGYAIISPKSKFIKSMADVAFRGKLYIYSNEKGLSSVANWSDARLDDYIRDGVLHYITIPIIESEVEGEFLNGLEFTGHDREEVLYKLEDKLSWISVIATKDIEMPNDKTDFDSETKGIFERLSFNDLEDFGHCSSCPTMLLPRKLSLFEGKKNELYLPFTTSMLNRLYYPYPRRPDLRRELYLRNVLVRDFRYAISVNASIFDTRSIVTNIQSRKFIPDISRNNMDSDSRRIINYIIGRALHQGAADKLKLESPEKEVLNNFIHRHYSSNKEYFQ